MGIADEVGLDTRLADLAGWRLQALRLPWQRIH
jgi:hypothetical protein